MLLSKKVANQLSTAIGKDTKYYPMILENRDPSALGTLLVCAVQIGTIQIVVLEENVTDLVKIQKD